jgi:hypothetical protein
MLFTPVGTSATPFFGSTFATNPTVSYASAVGISVTITTVGFPSISWQNSPIYLNRI